MTDLEKTRVLFVDDEPLVLQGLQQMLRPMRNEWEMAFVESGSAALQLLSETPFQVIVSDVRMPDMNGAQLLAQVQELHPETVRLIFSDHGDTELILKCVGTAQQFLSKPVEPDALRTAINRSREFDSSLKTDRIKQLVGQMERLPSVPAVLSEIVQKLQRESCSVDDIAELIGKDIAMTAKLLKLVNSVSFGLRRQVSSPSDAVSYLGIETIKSLVLALNAFAPFTSQGAGPLPVEGLWNHSLEVAGAAKRIGLSAGATLKESDDLFVAGMLHDVGKLALASNLASEYAKVLGFSNDTGVPLHAAEESVFGANHAEIGGSLLSLWGLSPIVVEAITFHHQPAACEIEARLPVMSVHVADALIRASANPGPATDLLLDMRFMESAGFSDRIDEWRELLQDDKSDEASDEE